VEEEAAEEKRPPPPEKLPEAGEPALAMLPLPRTTGRVHADMGYCRSSAIAFVRTCGADRTAVVTIAGGNKCAG